MAENQPPDKILRSDTVSADLSKVRAFGMVPLESFRGKKLPTVGEVRRRICFYAHVLRSTVCKKVEGG